MAMYSETRAGNRGGWENFKWEDVRQLPYKERERYLGVTNKLGYLDKGGKWRSQDWWNSYDPEEKAKKEELKKEIALIKK